MLKCTLPATLLASTVLTTGAFAQEAELIIESWRNDDLAIWQDQIIPAFQAQHPDIKVKFPLGPRRIQRRAEFQARRGQRRRHHHLPAV